MDGPVVVGRERELDVLGEALSAVARGEPRVVIVEGVAGVGKSSLLRAFRTQQGDVDAIAWAGDSTETDLPLAMIGQLLSTPRPPAEPYTAGAMLLTRIGELADAGPLLVLLDDLHLADRPSLVALNFAARRLRHDPVLLLMSARLDHVAALPASLLGLAGDEGRIRLSGLAAPEVRTLATTLDVGTISRRAAERLHSLTEGNPLHLRALLTEVPVAQLERMDHPIPAPRSFAHLVLADLDAASAAARRVACAAAVLGERCPLPVLVAVSGLERATVLDAIEELHDLRLLHLPPGSSSAAFDHPLVRAAVYGDLGPATRTALHHSAAQVLDGVASLQHRMAAASGPDGELADDLEHWSAREREAGNLLGAAEAMLASHRATPPGPDADRRLLRAVSLLSSTGDARGAQVHAAAVDALPVTGLRLAVQARLAWLTGRHDEATTLGREAWTRSDLDPLERDLVAAMLTQILVLDDRGAEAVVWADRALADGRLAPSLASHTRAQRTLGLALSGRFPEAVASLVDLPSDPAHVDPTRHPELSARGHLRLWSGPRSDAQADLAAASVLTHGDFGPFRQTAAAGLGQSLFHGGQWDQAHAVFLQVLALGEDLEQIWILGFLHACCAMVPAARGDWPTARRHLADAQHNAARSGNEASRAYVAEASVLLATASGDAEAVVRAAAEVRRAPATAARREVAIFAWPVHLVAALVELGRLDEAEEELAVLAERARPGHTRTEAVRVRLEGQLAAKRHDVRRARACLTAAAEGADDEVDALERALALEALGRFLRRRGERRCAVERLRLARDRYRALGAAPFVERCDRELAACGVHDPSKPSASDPLTPQERAVATLVCAGRTNRQAAEELVLSVKTVGYHLANVYLKLGVHSRAQLVAAMRDPAR